MMPQILAKQEDFDAFAPALARVVIIVLFSRKYACLRLELPARHDTV